MPATRNIKLAVRTGGTFGYPVAPGLHVYAGQLLMLNAAKQVQPLGVAGGVAFAGVAQRELDNTGNAGGSAIMVEVARGQCIQAAVAGGNGANNLGGPVYASDDVTYTTNSNSGANPLVGTLAGFENGTWVRISR